MRIFRMTVEVEAGTAAEPSAPADLPTSDRTRILIYLGVLALLVGFGAPFGGLVAVPVSYFLKNRLHFGAVQVAAFGLVTGIPLYISAASGFVRDNWSPFGIRDR